MQKNLRLTVLVLALLSIMLFLLIIGPQAGASIAASNDNVDSLEPKVVDSGDETTNPAIEKNDMPKDVTDENKLPEVIFELKYDKYPLTNTYLLVQNDPVKIRKGPSVTEAALRTAPKNEKLNYIETVTNDKTWYHVTWHSNGQQLFGFVNADVVIKREFQFDKMLQSVLTVEKAAESGPLTYISNYHNLKGKAPLYHGAETDQLGGQRSQSAPGYPDASNLSEFRYLSDGVLVNVLSSGTQYTRVSLLNDDKVYFVPNNYVAAPAAMAAFTKAVVIDRGNQNEAVFEKTGSEWKVISYTLATTGSTGRYHQPTPLGYYYGIEKRERFYYYEDGTTKIQGYAPYAVRFAGGAYIHGVPVVYKFNTKGERIDPGKVEYSSTLGTVPLSHKCVRNYTSHAKFLYDWYTPGNMAVIVME